MQKHRDPYGWIRHTLGGLAMIAVGIGVAVVGHDYMTGEAGTIVTGLGVCMMFLGLVVLFT